MKRQRKLLLLPFLVILFCISSANAQKGLWVGAELLADHNGNNGLNFFGGYFNKKEQTLYLAPYLQAGYMPKMTFDDSISHKFISMEAGMSAVLQFDVFKVKLSVAPVQYIPLDFNSLFSAGKTLLMPSLSLGTGESILGVFDINIYYGHSIHFGPPNGISYKLSDPYSKAGINFGVHF